MRDRDDTRHVRPGDIAADEPLPSGAAEPVDVAQVRADEALIEALRGAEPVRADDPIDDRLAGLLQAWRDDVDDEPVKPIDMNAVMAALTQAPRPRRRQLPLGPLASAAAVAMVVFVGIGIAAGGAAPGDALWSVSKVLYSERAQSIEAAATVRQKLGEANEALDSGNVLRASEALEQAMQSLPAVTEDGDKEQLTTQVSEIESKINDGTTGGTTTLPETPSQPPSASAPATTTPAPQPEQPSPTGGQTTTPSAPEPTGPTEPSQPTSTTEGGSSGGTTGGSPGETPGAGELGGGQSAPATVGESGS